MTATPRVPATDLMSVEAARALTDQIRDDAEMLWAKIVDAYTGRVWQILGYSSWDTYCGTEFGNMRLRLPKEERRDVVCSLRESGLSDRAIESATGISRRTLIRDRQSGGDNVTTSPEVIDAEVVDAEVVPEPKPITGTDGKTYKPKRKSKPKPEPTPPGGITEDTPGMTDAVKEALAKAKATQIAQQGEEPDQEPVEDVSDIDATVDQALADARTAPASQEEEPKPVPEWSAAEKVAKFRLIWNCQEDEEEPEEVEDICVENLEFYRGAGRVRDLFDGLLRYEPLPKTAWTGRKRELGEIKYYDLIVDAVIMHFGVDTVAERLHHHQEATKKEESQS